MKPFPVLLLSLLSLALLMDVSSGEPPAFREVGIDNPALQIRPSSILDQKCERVHISCLSRLSIKSYANVLHITVNASDFVPKKLHSTIEVHLHRNGTVGLCHFENERWHPLENGQWNMMMSPYEDRYIDIRFGDIHGSVSITAREEFQQWRLFFYAFGFLLLILAPIVSSWVPFYYSTSMLLGVLLVVLFVLFQGMKLVPMGRKSFLYLTLYGSLLGVGSFIAHYFTNLVNSILANFGLNEEMRNPVAVFLLVGIILAGAALGYWIVRKFVLSENGTVDTSVADFVKWAMRVIGAVAILQSTPDVVLAVITLASSLLVCFFITKKSKHPHPVRRNLWKGTPQKLASHRNAEFYSRSGEKGLRRSPWHTPDSTYSRLPQKAKAYTNSGKKSIQQQDHYSTFHKTPTPRFSKKEWEDFTRESTRDALSEWAATPEVGEWLAENAHRLRMDNSDNRSDDDSLESSEGSSEETEVENAGGLGLFKWY